MRQARIFPICVELETTALQGPLILNNMSSGPSTKITRMVPIAYGRSERIVMLQLNFKVKLSFLVRI